jgi:hypothetical protein
MRKRLRSFPIVRHAVIGYLCVMHVGAVFAWGNLGHRITGLTAEELLTPTARHEVQSLLGDETLADAATYMDTHRDELRQRWPESAHWHYDNKEVCDTKPYCRDGACATRQIEHWQRLLADKNNSRQQRALALRLLIHMIGDIHQPLHMADNHDRGGNDVWVRMYSGAERRRLHEIFDTELVRDDINHQRDYRYAHDLIAQHRAQLHEWQQGEVNGWANESYQLGVRYVYGTLPGFACGRDEFRTITFSSEYLRHAHELVELQLAKAGVRIAAVLNSTLP